MPPIRLAMGLTLAAALPLSAAAQTAPQQLPLSAQWCLAGQPQTCIDLEVARTPQQQSLGLQRRPPLPPLRGMWFPFAVPTPTRFWMHLTPEPLDMLFVSQQQVVAVVTEAKPCMHLPCRSYGPDVPVDGVIELAGGAAARLGIGVGTPVQIRPLATLRQAAER